MVLASFVLFSFTFGFGTWQDPWIWYVGFSIYSCSRKRKKKHLEILVLLVIWHLLYIYLFIFHA